MFYSTQQMHNTLRNCELFLLFRIVIFALYLFDKGDIDHVHQQKRKHQRQEKERKQEEIKKTTD